MKKLLLLIIAMNFVFTSALAADDENIFAKKTHSFATETQMSEYIKTNKPSTFVYFNKLSDSLKKKAFRKHQEDNQKDITEIVLTLYRKR